jgi:hypothetical protein
VGILVDVFLRGGPIGVGAALTIATVTVGLLALAPDRSPERWAFAGLALLASVGLVIRASPWIVVLDWVAALGFLGLAASATPDHPVVGSSLSRLAFRSGAPPVASAASGPVTLVESMSTIRRRPRETGSEPSTLQRLAPGVVRGLILAVPTVALLGALLASADGVFASFFDLPTPEVGGVWSHLFLIGSGAAAVAGLARWTRDPQPAAEPGRRPLGPVEALVVLGGMTVLYALFALAQVVATTGGDARVQATTGLTYAEYARSGFFQLLWCAAITIAVLLGLRAMTRPGGPRQQLAVRVLSATTCALTLVVVGTAITRLELYRDAYGLTMLRLACTTFGWVLGVAFVLLGVRMLQTGARDWLPAAYLGLAVVTLGWWNLSNPEARVAETNLQQVATTGLLDVDYLDSLSDDAIPTILGGLDDLPPDRAGEIRERLCRPIDPGDQREDLRPITRSGYSRPGHVVVDPDGVVRTRPGILAHNVARESARAALQECADEVGR